MTEVKDDTDEVSKESEESGALAKPKVGKTANAITTTTFSALFKPSADLIGQELKSWTENKLNEKKKARVQENTAQAKIINPKIDEAEIKSEKQLENFERWVEGVSEVDAEDPIAIAWQKILLDITEDNYDADLVLAALKSLDRAEAAFFVQYVKGKHHDMHPDKRDYYMACLIEKNILIKEDLSRTLYRIIDNFNYRIAKFIVPLRERSESRRPAVLIRLTWVGEALAEYVK